MIGAARTGVAANYRVERNPANLVLSESSYANEVFSADTGQFDTPITTGTVGSFAVTGGGGVITHTSGSARATYIRTGAALSKPLLWVQVDIAARAAVSPTFENVKLGIAKDASNLIYGDYRRFDAGGTVVIVVLIGGVATTITVATGVGALTPPFKLAFSIYKNILQVYLDTGTGWTRKGHYDCTAQVDLTAIDLSGWKAAFGLSSDTNATSVVTYDNFRAYAGQNYFDFQPTALRWVNEGFASDTGQFLPIVAGGVLSLAAGVGTITHSAVQEDIVCVGAPIDFPQACVSCDITARTGTPTTNSVGIGIGRNSQNYVLAEYLFSSTSLRITSRIGGVLATDGAVSITLTAPFKLAFMLLENEAAAWVDRGNGWERIASVNLNTAPRVDMRATDLTSWRGCFSSKSDGGASTWSYDNFRVGRFGAVALHDMCMVTTEDGRPYVSGGLAYFLATSADAVDSYEGVFSLNLSTYEILQTGVIFASRSGQRRMDKAGHLVVHSDGTYRLLLSGWSGASPAAPPLIYYASTTTNLLSGSSLVATSLLTLPGITAAPCGCYDPFLLKVGATWQLAYTISPNYPTEVYYPALAQSSDLVTWTAVGGDPSRVPYEGTRILRTRGRSWVLAGGRNDAHVYDDAFGYVGTLAMLEPQLNALPHPMIFPNGNKQVLLTFDEVRWLSTSNPSRGVTRVMTSKRFVRQ